MDMSMRVINWEKYVKIGTGDRGSGTRVRCQDNDIAPDFNNLQSPVPSPQSLAITIGVFDGVHLGHQSLIRRICEPLASEPRTPTVVTFRENPIKSLKPAGFAGDIYNLDQKLGLLESLGVKLTVLIDFSEKFSKMNGRDFIDLLLKSQPVTLLVLGENFHCGQGRNIGVKEIQSFARARGVETWVAPPVMDGGQPISSNRIRQALVAGRFEEAQRMLGRSLDSIPFNTICTQIGDKYGFNK
jgi:riboflavin kinase/FMN adenylyltransferase